MFLRFILLLLSIFLLTSCTSGTVEKHSPQQAIGKQADSKEQITHQVAFRTPDLFDNHFQKHVIKQKEFGNITKEEYLKKAQALVSQKGGGNILIKKNSEGDTLFFNRETNEFAVLSKDGYIRTFFKPQDGIAYFNKQ
jgi:pyocin large subunit-like protein